MRTAATIRAYREDHCQAWQGEGPQAIASSMNLPSAFFT